MIAAKFRRPFATLALAASILGLGAGAADAALGIIIVETDLEPVGDPLTEFNFRLALAPQNSLIRGDNITLLNIPNFGGGNRYVFSSMGIDYSQFFTLSNLANPDGTTQIKLEWTASIINLVNNSPTDLLPIGNLYVETTVDYVPAPGSPLYGPINYTTQTHTPGGIDRGSGVAVARGVVPEPASLILLGVGAPTGVLLSRRRRRRHCPA